ncbi:hypothetical protein B0H17DRAFT_948255, partial [Mycena rosella]
RLFAILVSTAWHLIWNLRVNRVIRTPDSNPTPANIHNQWLSKINAALRQDRILTDKFTFRPLAFKKPLILDTWSGLLMNEDALPDDWTFTEGVLVGIQPLVEQNGIG